MNIIVRKYSNMFDYPNICYTLAQCSVSLEIVSNKTQQPGQCSAVQGHHYSALSKQIRAFLLFWHCGISLLGCSGQLREDPMVSPCAQPLSDELQHTKSIKIHAFPALFSQYGQLLSEKEPNTKSIQIYKFPTGSHHMITSFQTNPILYIQRDGAGLPELDRIR